MNQNNKKEVYPNVIRHIKQIRCIALTDFEVQKYYQNEPKFKK